MKEMSVFTTIIIDLPPDQYPFSKQQGSILQCTNWIITEDPSYQELREYTTSWALKRSLIHTSQFTNSSQQNKLNSRKIQFASSSQQNKPKSGKT